MISHFTLTTVSLVLALYAAILSTIVARRDRREVKVSFSRETEYFEEDGIGGAGETVTKVTVTNTGRRPVTIRTLRAYLLFPKRGFVELEFEPKESLEIKEGQWVGTWTDDEHVDLSETQYFEAEDGAGNPYRANVAPWYVRSWSTIRRKLLK